MEIKELAQKAKENDSRAWTELFAKTKDMVYFTALKLCANKENAEDIVQETYIKAMQNISSLSAPEAFVTWLRTIAVNTTRNHLAKNNPTIFGSDESDELLLNTPEMEENFLPEEYASKRETARIIMRIIDSLPEKQRVTVMLYYYNEVSVADIAKMMDVSENTVKSRLNYARTEIKRQVEELEKKGTKLHGAAVPFLALALREAAKDYVLAEETAAAISATIAATAATAATATTVAAATSGGIIAKIAALPIATKIIAGVLSAAVAIGSIAAVVTGVTQDRQDDGETENYEQLNAAKLTAEKQKEYKELDLVSLLFMDNTEVEAKFGGEYEIDDYGDYYFYSYGFEHDNGADVLILMFDTESGNVTDVQFFGSLFNYEGLCTHMSIDEAKENLANRGFVLRHTTNRTEEFGEFTEENYNSPDGNVSVYMMYTEEMIENLSLSYIHMPPTETTEAPAETTEAPIETTEVPVETTAPPVVVTPAEKTLLYTFKQNDANTNGVNETYIPNIRLFSDGTVEGLANIYYATLKFEGTWEKQGSDYTISISTPDRSYEFNTEEFNLHYQDGESFGVVTFYPGDSMGITYDGATFDIVGYVPAPDASTNEGAHKILEEFRLNNRTASDGSISYAYADVTHDGIEELIVMTNSEGPSVENPSAAAYYEVFTLAGGEPVCIFEDATGFTTNSMYEHYLYSENGKAYLMRAAFFERQGSPWYFYEIFSLDNSGEKISLRGRDVQLEYGYTDSSPLDLVRAEYKDAVNSSEVLVLPYADAYDDFWATTGWWYKD